MNDEVHEGLEGVVVTRTMLSSVDGEAGKLIIGGRDVEELAATSSFEEATARLFELGGLAHDDMAARIAEGRARTFELLPQLEAALAVSEPMVALRAAVDLLPLSVAVDPAHVVGAVGL